MLHLAPNKVYKLRVTFPDTAETVDDVALGNRVEDTLKDLQKRYPGFKRIIAFDSDTGDIVSLIKK